MIIIFYTGSGPFTASLIIDNGSSKPGMIMTHTTRPITPSNAKFSLKNSNRSKRGFSDVQFKRTNSNGSRDGKISKMRPIPQSMSNPSSPHNRAATYTSMQLMTPQVNAGAYRLGMNS